LAKRRRRPPGRPGQDTPCPRALPKTPLKKNWAGGAEFARIYAIQPRDPDETDFYESNLYASSEAERLPCSARSIIYCPTVVAGFVAVLVTQYATGKSLPRELLLDLASLLLSH
jgi:hypothetical protein